MNYMKTKQVKLSLLIASFVLIIGAGFSAQALVFGSNAVVSFVAPITVTANTLPNFGNVITDVSGQTLTLSTTGAISGANSSDYVSGALAGNYTIKGSASSTIAISIGGYGADHNVVPSAATCAYNGGAVSSPCNLSTQVAPGNAGKTLLVGLTMTTNNTETDGTVANPTFQITVVYD